VVAESNLSSERAHIVLFGKTLNAIASLVHACGEPGSCKEEQLQLNGYYFLE